MNEHIVSMYALLPTMRGANADVLLQALTEMAEHYKGQEMQLANQLKWLGVLLRRAEIMPAEDQREIQEQLDMWDNLLEEDEYLQKKIVRAAEKRAEKLAEQRAEKLAEQRAEKLAKELVEKQVAEARAEVERKLAELERRQAEVERKLVEEEAKVKAEGEMQASQTILIDVVQTRFPVLVELARQRAAQTKQPEALREVIRLISTAPDEATARWILGLTPAA